jgi:phage shock protein C
MFCTQCGTKLDDSARYCTSCGKPTNAESPRTVPPPPPPSEAAARKLHRVLAGKKLAGVCAGFAEYFDMDVTLMRLIWVGLALIPPHLGVIGYIVSWVVLPVR